MPVPAIIIRFFVPFFMARKGCSVCFVLFAARALSTQKAGYSDSRTDNATDSDPARDASVESAFTDTGGA